jgi:type IV pilus assembly protein PilB
MPAERIGNKLRQIARLTDLDVEEILQEQAYRPRRFGEVAISLGMCTPSDVWRAWFQQIGHMAPYVNLAEFGVDSQATAVLPRELAMEYHMVPLRVMGNQVVAAIADGSAIPPDVEVSTRLQMEVRFVRADPRQVDAAIAEHYGALLSPA